MNDLKAKLKKKKGVSLGLYEQYISVMQGYVDVDKCLNACERIGREALAVMNVWSRYGSSSRSRTASPMPGSQGTDTAGSRETGMHIASVDPAALKQAAETEADPKIRRIIRMYHTGQPKALAEGIKLKDYQLVGLNWLKYMFDRKQSCILADEMG